MSRDDWSVLGIVLVFLFAGGLVAHSCTRFDWGTKYCEAKFAAAKTAADSLAVTRATEYCYTVLTRQRLR